MNFNLSSEQNILRESAHKLLARECTSDFVREMAQDETGHDSKLWNKMAQLGWMSLLVPEACGGSGESFFDLALILMEMGYYAMPGPFFSTVILGGIPVLEAGSEAQKKEILGPLADGKRLLTLALTEADGTYTPGGVNLSAVPEDGRYVLNGTKLFVPDAHVADTVICAARTDASTAGAAGVTLFLVDAGAPGLAVEPLETMAGDKQFAVVFDGVRVPETDVLGTPGKAWPVIEKVLRMAAVAKCAEMTGGARKVMDLAIPYVKGRKQFGRPVAAFQSIQHHCADMLTLMDTMEFMTCQAAWRISAGLPFEKEAAMCKAWVSDACRKLVGLGHQVIGGVGFMEEYDLQLYFKRGREAEMVFGSAEFHREQVAQEMGL
jgi:3-oxocholest-4-en-26-oyl-CoA dehydrogenase beta subunit